MKREELLSKYANPIEVLNHGFVRLVDVMGGDSSIVQAARVSYGKGTKTSREDRGLIRYLLRKRHTSPFEMCEIKLHCKMPIFVARQWIRHRTASVNEYSGRYSEMPDEFYIPIEERVNPQGGVSAQSSDESEVMANAESLMEYITDAQSDAFSNYKSLLSDGLSRELSRVVTPMGTYTQWYWKIDLHNLLHFLGLRLDAHAQWEIRQFAEAIATIVKDWVPFVWEAFKDYRLGATTFSEPEAEAVSMIMRRGGIENISKTNPAHTTNLAKSEIAELIAKLERFGIFLEPDSIREKPSDS